MKSILAEIFEKHLAFPEQALEAVGESDRADGSPKDEAVDAAQNTDDFVRKIITGH